MKGLKLRSSLLAVEVMLTVLFNDLRHSLFLFALYLTVWALYSSFTQTRLKMWHECQFVGKLVTFSTVRTGTNVCKGRPVRMCAVPVLRMGMTTVTNVTVLQYVGPLLSKVRYDTTTAFYSIRTFTCELFPLATFGKRRRQDAEIDLYFKSLLNPTGLCCPSGVFFHP